jgi:hypothetical protein
MAALAPISKANNLALGEVFKTAQLLAAADPGQGFEGAAFALREALSGNFRSLAERFEIPLKALNSMKAAGVPTIEAINRVLASMGITLGLVDAQANTLQGQWNKLNNAFGDIKLAFAQPVVAALSSAIASLTATLAANGDTLEGFAQRAGTAVGAMIGDLITGLPTAVDAVRTFIGSLTGSWTPAAGITQFHSIVGQIGLAIAFARDAVITFIGALNGNWAGQASNAINPVHQAIGNIGLWIRNVALPALVALGQWFTSTGLPAFQAFAGWVETNVVPALQTVGDWVLAEGLPALQALGAWMATDGLAALQAFGNWFNTDGIRLLDSFRGLIQEVGRIAVDIVGPAFSVLATRGGEILAQVNPLVVALRDMLTVLSPIGTALGLVFGAIAAAIPAQIQLLTGFVQVMTGTFGLIGSLVGGIVGAFTALARGDTKGALDAITASFGEFNKAGNQVAAGIGTIGSAAQKAGADLGIGAILDSPLPLFPKGPQPGVTERPPLPGAPGGVTERPPVPIGPPAPTPEELERQQRLREAEERAIRSHNALADAQQRHQDILDGIPTDWGSRFAAAMEAR